MPLTRGARHRLPAGEFRDDDLVIDLPQPHSPTLSVSTLTRLEPSNEDDETRYQRFRKHFEQEYGPGRIKTKGKDDFMPLEEGQILVGRVYGYYEVNHWPGADEQFKKSKTILGQLKDEGSKSSDSSSELDAFDDEEADETFAGDDEYPLLPTSAARTIEDSDEDESPLLQRTPASAVLRRTHSQKSAPELGDFTPAQLRQLRQQSQKDANTKRTSTISQRKESQISDLSIHRSRIPPPNTQVPPPQQPDNAALTVLARLDQRRQEDIDNGFVSPSTHRQYTKQERMLVVGPEIMNERRQSWPRNMLKKKRSRPNEEEGSEYGDENPSKKVVKKPKRKRGLSQSTKHLSLPAQRTVSPTLTPRIPSQQHPAAIARGNIYPPLPVGIFPNSSNVWPVVDENQSRLSSGYQVRVQYINDASTVLSTYVKSQAASVTATVIKLEDSLVYTLLMTDEGRDSGWEECSVRARKSIFAKLESFETQWRGVSKDAGMRFTAPDPDTIHKHGGKGFYTTARGKKAMKPARGKQGGGGDDQNEPGNDSSTQAQAGVAPHYQLAPVPTNANNKPKPKPDFSTRPLFLNTLTPTTYLQVSYLLETIRFQTAIPSALRLSRSSDSDLGGVSAQRAQYESNMRLGALSWQADFFESWARRVERDVMSGVVGGGLRFWKLKALSQDEGMSSGGERKWLAVDFLTSLKGIVDEEWTPPNPRVYGEQEFNTILEMAGRGRKEIASTSNRTHKADLRQFVWEKILKSAEAGNSQVDYQQNGDAQDSPFTAAVRQAQESDLAAEQERQRRLKMQAGMQVPADLGFNQYPSMGPMERYQYEMMLQQDSGLGSNLGPSLPPRRVLNYEYVDPRLLTRPYSMPMPNTTGMGTQMGTTANNYGQGRMPIDPALQVTDPFQFRQGQQRQGDRQFWQHQSQQQQTNQYYPTADPRFSRRPSSHLSQYFLRQFQQPQPVQQSQYPFQSGSGYQSRPAYDSGSGFRYNPQSAIDPSLLSNINRPTNPTNYMPGTQQHYDSSTNFPTQASRTRPGAPDAGAHEYMGPSPAISPTTLPASRISKEDKGKGRATSATSVIADLIAGLQNDIELELGLQQTPHGTARVHHFSSSPRLQATQTRGHGRPALEEGFGSAALSDNDGTRDHGTHAPSGDHGIPENEPEPEIPGMFFHSSPPNAMLPVDATREESLSPLTVRGSEVMDVFAVGDSGTNTAAATSTTLVPGKENEQGDVNDKVEGEDGAISDGTVL